MKYELYGITGEEIIKGYLDGNREFELKDSEFNPNTFRLSCFESCLRNGYRVYRIMHTVVGIKNPKSILIKTFNSDFNFYLDDKIEHNSEVYYIDDVVFDETNNLRKLYTNIEYKTDKINEDEKNSLMAKVVEYNKRASEENEKEISRHKQESYNNKDNIIDKIKKYLFRN